MTDAERLLNLEYAYRDERRENHALREALDPALSAMRAAECHVPREIRQQLHAVIDNAAPLLYGKPHDLGDTPDDTPASTPASNPPRLRPPAKDAAIPDFHLF